MNSQAVRELARKELRQLRRSKRALITALIMPGLMLLYFPLLNGKVFAFRPTSTTAVDIDITPAVGTTQPGGRPVLFCALVTYAGSNETVPGVMLVFNPRAVEPPRATDRTGKACAHIPAPETAGDYPVTAFPLNRRLRMVHTAGRLVADAEPASVPAPQPSPSPSLPAFLAVFGDPGRLFSDKLLPLFILIAGGLVAPTFAMQTTNLERERGTLPLLAALPVRPMDIVVAKVVTVVGICAAVTVPFLLIDLAVLGVDALGGFVQTAADFALLLSGLAGSAGLTLLITLLVKDVRTSNGLVGLLSLPAMALFAAVIFVLPAPLNMLIAAVLLLGAGGLAVFAARRWITFERYLE